MNNYVIDWGNTRIKAGLFENGRLKNQFTADNPEEIATHISSTDFSSLLISSVADDPQMLDTSFQSVENKIILGPKTPLPFNNHYLTKETLGNDRKAAVAGAQKLFPDATSLVIDIGSCITYDLLENGIDYQGGMISPGINIRLRGMHQFTGRLPLINDVKDTQELIGRSTRDSMVNGVLNGIKAELKGIVESLESKKGEMQVIMTGGDLLYFESSIKGNIFASPEIVLVGLNAILEFNEK